MPNRAAPSLVLTAVLAAAGCREKPKPAPAASARASARPAPVPRPPSSAGAPKPAPVGCRVLTLQGNAPSAPKPGDLLDGRSFFELPEGAVLSLRHSETTRELTLKGPGRFRACPKGEELVAVTRGTVTTTSGPGARAGAEVRLATPFGVVRFADAALTLRVTAEEAAVSVTQGYAVVDGRTKEDGPAQSPVSGPRGRSTFRGRSDAKALVAACEKQAAGLATPVPAGSASENLGRWAVERLKARQAARYACSRALAAVGLVEGPDADRLWDQVSARIVVTGSGAPPTATPEK